MKTLIKLLFIILTVNIVNAQEIMIGSTSQEIISTNYEKYKTKFEAKNTNGTLTLETDYDESRIAYIMVNDKCTGIVYIFFNRDAYYSAIKLFSRTAKEGVYYKQGNYFHFKIKNGMFTLLIGTFQVDW
jgi:hypothetical protein